MPVKQKQPSWEKHTPNPKLQGKNGKISPAKISPRHDMSKGKTYSFINLP